MGWYPGGRGYRAPYGANNRADAVFFISAGTPGMVYHGQVILNIG